MKQIVVRCTSCKVKDLENAFAPEHENPRTRRCWNCGEKSLVIREVQKK